MKNTALVFAFALVLFGPLLLREKQSRALRGSGADAEETLVVLTPNNEATRFEFGRAFRESVFAKTGRRVRIDWRTPGGASEISNYLRSEYLGAFQNYWTNILHRPWSAEVEAGFANPKVAPTGDTPAGRARRTFLESSVGCGIDILFGGGSFDFIQQAEPGRLVDCGVVAAHPELFNPGAIPQTLGGEMLWDPHGRWIGACLGAFGICWNTDSLARLGIAKPPTQWRALADPAYLGEIALADPTQSGSIAKVFEMVIQQQMAESGSPAAGWERAMRLIQEIGGNARYFTDSAAKIPFDVEMGDAAAGMCIDFYGRFESEFVRKPGGVSRLQYATPAGGSSVGADPIGLLRGAPHAALARQFIEFVLSREGQKLWDFKVGAPGGPVKYALRRLPILPELYAPEYAEYRSDPEVDPYKQAEWFVYHPEWTGALFRVIAFTVRAMCIDPHDELREAWRALIAANFPPEAAAVFHDVSAVSFEAANGRIRETLRSPRRIDSARLADELAAGFRARYRRAAELARAGK